MNRRVLKWPVPVDDQVHRIGRGRVVMVDVQHDDPATVYVWTEEDGEPKQDRPVRVFGTGHLIPLPSQHVGSVQHPFGLVWHVYAVPGA